ncbi:MAG: emp24/gp25L/p24 family protein [Caldimicrobium sp.]
MLSIIRGSLFFLILLFLLNLEAFAHKINLFITQVEDRIEGEGFFADGSPCKNCEITVFDPSEKEILKIKTDEKGKFSFSLPEKVERVKIILSAGEGHIVEKTVTIKRESKEKKVMPKIEADKKRESENNLLVDEKLKESFTELNSRIINLEAEVKALREEMLNLRKDMQKIAYRDIIGALGYLLGIFAIIYFIKKRHAS